MEGLSLLMILICGVVASKQALRIYLSVKHPQIRDAMDEAAERRFERNKRLGVGAAKAGFTIFKMLKK